MELPNQSKRAQNFSPFRGLTWDFWLSLEGVWLNKQAWQLKVTILTFKKYWFQVKKSIFLSFRFFLFLHCFLFKSRLREVILWWKSSFYKDFYDLNLYNFLFEDCYGIYFCSHSFWVRALSFEGLRKDIFRLIVVGLSKSSLSYFEIAKTEPVL